MRCDHDSRWCWSAVRSMSPGPQALTKTGCRLFNGKETIYGWYQSRLQFEVRRADGMIVGLTGCAEHARTRFLVHEE